MSKAVFNALIRNLVPVRFGRLLYTSLAVLFSLAIDISNTRAAESPFPLLPGLEPAVAFWKEIFTRYGPAEVVFFDPQDPATIYSVIRVPDGDEGRSAMEKERARIIAEYELNEADSRVRSQRGAKEQFMAGLKISGRYMPEMKKIFREEGVPVELAYLPLVESSFNVRARSSVGALGMWQFMAATGKKFLRIDEAIDERRDPLLSTRAAARLLKQNHRLLGNWPLAITAYNHGTEGMFRAVDEVGSENLVEMIRRYQSPSFGFASKNFYAEFLAAVEIASNSEAYFPLLKMHPPRTLHEVAIKLPLPLQSLLQPAAISETDFFDWNPAFNPTVTMLPLGYPVKVPADQVDRFMAALRRVFKKPAKKAGPAVARSRQTVNRLEAALEKQKPRNDNALQRVAARAKSVQQSRPASNSATAMRQRLKIAQR
jgi:membrane-bound lytic murein transglycosylase D